MQTRVLSRCRYGGDMLALSALAARQVRCGMYTGSLYNISCSAVPKASWSCSPAHCQPAGCRNWIGAHTQTETTGDDRMASRIAASTQTISHSLTTDFSRRM